LSSKTPDWLNLLRAQTDRFAGIVEHGDLGAPITFCPGWSLQDLVEHLGGVHQWAAHAVVAGDPIFEPEPAEQARPALVTWYRRHASHLLNVLAERPADAPAWTMDTRDPTAGFWRRRQFHETALHNWDAEQALGEPQPMEPALAWDGVIEAVEVMYPRQVRLGRVAPLNGSVRLVALDVTGDITIGEGEQSEVRERAEVLLRLLWHRDPNIAHVDARAAALLSTAVTP
jgi:uncharacterized protein (TIGR03083 family)